MRRDMKKQQIVKRDTISDGFFEIDDGRLCAGWGLHVLAGAICIFFAMWVWMLNPIAEIHGDQINIVTMVLSKKNPANFTRDIIFGGRMADNYPVLVRWIIGFFIEKFGVIGGHRVIQFPLSVTYLLVMYGVLYYLTRSVPAAVLTAMGSVMWRWSMGETYWGLDRVQAVQPRSFAIIFFPVLLILLWKFRDSWKLLIPFFGIGLTFNINPPSSLSFAVLSWWSLFLVSLRDRNRILRLIAGAVVFVVGSAPYLFVNLAIRKSCAINLTGRALREHIETVNYWAGQSWQLYLPAKFFAKAFMAGFSVLILLAVIAWCLRKKKRNLFDNWLVCFFALAFVGTIMMYYVIRQLYIWFNIPMDLFDLLRGNKFAYMILYIYVALLLAWLLRRFVLRDRCVLIAVVALIVVMMPAFWTNSKDPWGQWGHNSRQAEVLLGGKKIEVAGWHERLSDVSTWARQNTPEDSLFLFADHFADPFRIYALRSVIVCSRLYGGGAMLNGAGSYARWTKYQQALREIIARGDIRGLLELAAESRADYIIVANGRFARIAQWPIAMRDRFWTVYRKP